MGLSRQRKEASLGIVSNYTDNVGPSTHERHVIIVNVTHGRVSVCIKNASLVASDAVGSDVAVPSNTITRRLGGERHVIVIVGEH